MKGKSERPTILFLNRSYPPDEGATGQLLAELCEGLSDVFDVVVVAGRVTKRSGGFPYFQRKKEGRVTIIRTPNTLFPKASSIGRMLNWISYLFFAFFASFTVKANRIVCETDPPFLPIIGFFHYTFRKIPFIYYCQDIYPDVAVMLKKVTFRPAIYCLDWLNRFLFAKAEKVIVLGRDMKEVVLNKGIPSEHVAVISNWVDTQKIFPVKRSGNRFRKEQHISDERFVVAYSGNLGLTQDLDVVLDAADLLKGEADILFLIIGKGVQANLVKRLAKERNLLNVWLLSPQPQEDLSESLSAADIHLVPLYQGLGGLIVPSKIYGIMAVGRPFIAMADHGSEVCRIVDEVGCGFTVPPGNQEALFKKILFARENPILLKEMGKRARKTAEKVYDSKQSIKRFKQLLLEKDQ